MKKILLCAAACLAAGCASTQSSNEPAAQRVEREYTTGSNIPRKSKGGDGVQVYDREAAERARDAMPQLPPRGPGGGP
jgi:hypothetical protein